LLDDDVDLARDRALVTRAQAGDRSAFDDLYVRYYRRLYRFCLRRLHDSYEAEDVAQEAFSRAWRALPNFAGDRRFYPWLSVIAAHLCTDVLRRRNRSTPVAEFHQGNVASTEDSGEELMLAAVDSDLVARAFNRLSDRHQRILHLREGSGWSYQKIADHEGVGITAVETLLWRARQALKREFAALAGAEGRIAAWIGGASTLASLRRFLRVPAHAARRVVHIGQGGSAVAMGSAAAATAMVVAATLSGPMAQSHPVVPVGGSSGGFGAIAPTSIAPGGPAASSGGSGSSTRGGDTTAGAEVPGSGASAGIAHTLSGAASNIGGTAGSLGSVGNALGGTVNGAVNGIANGLSNTAQGVVNGLSNTVQGVTSSLSQLLSPVIALPNAVENLVGGSGGALNSTVSGLSGAVSGVANTTTQTVAGLLGGVLSAGSTTTSSTKSSSPSASTPSASGASTCSGNNLLGNLLGGVTGGLTGNKNCSS